MMRVLIGSVVVVLAAYSLKAAPPPPVGDDKPYDLVLCEDGVVFQSAEELSKRDLPLLVRDLGVKELDCFKFQTNLRIVWDGKQYGYEIGKGTGGTGPRKILPKTTWSTVARLSRYKIPREALNPGRHTISVQDDNAQSNTLTIFIGDKTDN